ncbi:MAG TPA: dihydrolipoamide acetyltransferase family protein, partial [Gemmatimonadaceae bacterium]|nr:dihydrolipoamide acetyltransferase family protein [Gemmatimonadaceae bacterium]
MARVDVVMPQMGESIAEGTLSKWLKKVGDHVKRDEPIFEISTDKVDAEIPAPSNGVLAEVLVTEGQTVPVQTVVARLETDVAAGVAAVASAPAPASSASSASSAATTAAAASAAAAAARPSAPARAPAAAVPQSPAPPAQQPGATNGGSLEDRLRTKSSPLVRRIAADHGIEISGMQGSGIAGRVTKKDIMQFIESGAAQVPARPSMSSIGGGTGAGAGGRSVHTSPLPEPWAGDRVEPMSRMRGIIAEHMVMSKHTSAHVNSFFEVDFTRIARIRAKNRAEFEKQTGEKLTYLPFIIKAVADGLRAHPVLNAAVRGNEIIYRKPINIGIAVALDWGLIVPVIKRADERDLLDVSRVLIDLANRARAKQLKPEDVTGGTFTITNPGVFGALSGTPIINQPQVAILGVGAIEKRPVVIDDAIAIRPMAYLTIGYDHRLIDGAVADQFMSGLKHQL